MNLHVKKYLLFNTKNRKFILFFVLLCHISFCAYLDPGSSSAILFLVITAITSLLYTLKGFFYSLFNLIRGRGFKDKVFLNNIDIVFYSEGKQYWNVFRSVIEALDKRKVKCAYLTSDKSDEGLQYMSPYVQTKYIGNIIQASVLLKRIKTKFVGMTTPQLDVLMLKRSKHVQHYGHIIHSPVDIFVYKIFAFDFYDSVFCSGKHQINNIRYLEKIRNTKPKKLFETGLTYFDSMEDEIKILKQSTFDSQRSIVLLAPSWKPECILNRFGADFISSLLEDESYDVILRPHPQTYISYPEIMEDILKNFSNEQRLIIDSAPSGTNSMIAADLMISDFSGIVWDFAFLHEKPVLMLDSQPELHGFEATYLPRDNWWEMIERQKIGKLFNEKDVKNIASIVKNLLDAPPKAEIKQLRNESVFNFKNAGKATAEQILKLINK